MFAELIQNILMGPSAGVEYLFALLVLSFVLAVAADAGEKVHGGGKKGYLLAALALFTASRALVVLSVYRVTHLYPVLSIAAAAPAVSLVLYYFMTDRNTGPKGTRFGRRIAQGVGLGLVMGIGLTAALEDVLGIDASITRVEFALSLIPVGMAVVLTATSYRKSIRGMLTAFFGNIFIALATPISVLLLLAEVAPAEILWQLFYLVDLAGFTFLVCSVVISGRPDELKDDSKEKKVVTEKEDVSGVREKIETLHDAVSGMKSGESIQTTLNRIVEIIADTTSARHVLLRSARSSEESFSLRSFAGLEELGTTSTTSFTVRREEVEKFFRRMGEPDPGVAVSPADAAAIEGFLSSALAGSNEKLYVVPMMNGEELVGFLTIAPCKLPVNDLTKRYISMLRDLAVHLLKTEELKKKLRDNEKAIAICREELDSVNQLKSNFLSVISHELRTPLTSIKAYAETLLDNLDAVEPGTVREFVRVMDGEAEKLIKLVDNILSFSYMETGNLRVEKTTFPLNELLSEVYGSLESDFLSKKISAELKLPKHSVAIRADKELIKQLLYNLLNNAVKFSPEGGRVVVSLQEEASAARITVQDSGRGIPEDQLEKVFERFHQVDASDTREYGGSGLGLAICKNIVDWHEGKIWVENVKSSGAKFTVLLPMKDIYVRQSISRGFIGSRRFERDRYLTLLVEMLAEFMQARKASIMMVDREQQILRILAAKGLDPEFVQNTRVEVGERIAGRVVETGEVMHVFDIERENEYGRANNSAYYGTRSFISVPMKDGGEIMGVLNVSDHVQGREFTEHDKEMLESLSTLIAGLIKKIEAYETVSSNFENLKNAMRSILEMRETWGSGTLSNLTLLALATARRLNLDDRSLVALRIGMNIYDLGLMRILRHIRAKKERLSRSDIEKLKRHPHIGFSLVSTMDLDEKVKGIVRSHHEMYNGAGYPDGLKGDAIPIEARIVSVVDAFRALISQGPYRRTYSFEEAKDEIVKGSGTRFDPKVVGAFLKALRDLGAREENGQLVLDEITKELEELRERFEKKEEVHEEVKEVAP